MPMRRMRMRTRPRRGYPARKRYKRTQTRKINRPVTANCKAVLMQQDPGPQTIDSKSVYGINLTTISQGSSRNARERHQIRFRGVYIRAQFRNKMFESAAGPLQAKPLIFNMAIVSPTTNNSSTFTPGDFFRLNGQTARATTAAASLPGLAWATLPINPDIFAVHWHTRFKLGATSTNGGYSSGELKNYRTLARYIKIPYVCNYQDSNSTSCIQPTFLVWWCNPFNETNGPLTVGCAETYLRVVTYFRDVKQN